jgi:hypothetical protein
MLNWLSTGTTLTLPIPFIRTFCICFHAYPFSQPPDTSSSVTWSWLKPAWAGLSASLAESLVRVKSRVLRWGILWNGFVSNYEFLLNITDIFLWYLWTEGGWVNLQQTHIICCSNTGIAGSKSARNMDVCPHYVTTRNIADSIIDGVIGFFNWLNPSSSTMALGSTQPLTEMNTGNLPGSKGRPASKPDLTAICEPIVYKMWEPRRLTALWASTACYRDSFTFIIGFAMRWSDPAIHSHIICCSKDLEHQYNIYMVLVQV